MTRISRPPWFLITLLVVLAVAGRTAPALATGSANLKVRVDGPAEVVVGAVLTHQVTVTNNGPDPATETTLTLVLAGPFEFDSATPSQASDTCTESDGTVTCALGTLAKKTTDRVDLVMTATGAGEITDGATVSAVEADPHPTNNTAAFTTRVAPPPGADMALSVGESADPLAIGGIVAYTFTAENLGPDTATAVTLTVTVSGPFSFESAAPSDPADSCSEAGGVVTCELGTIAASSAETVQLQVEATGAGTITVQGTAARAEPDPVPSNDSASEETTVVAVAADVWVGAAESSDPVGIGDPIAYTFTVGNLGPDPATQVIVTAALSGPFAFESVMPSDPADSCSEAGGTVTCELGTIAAASSESVELGVTATGAGVIKVEVAASAVEADPAPANNGLMESTGVWTRPNVVLILTDDQRWDTVWAMPNVQSLLQGSGVTFENAFVTTPLCCPSRASILTGRMAHLHGVYDNARGFDKFGTQDASTIATWLNDAGYRTGLFGKYLNSYDPDDAAYIPPGWDRWLAFVEPAGYGAEYSDQGALFKTSTYSTDYLAEEAAAFIQDTTADQPVFVYLSSAAPHAGTSVAARHRTAFADLAPWRPPSFNEADVSDKPSYAASQPLLTTEDEANLDSLRIKQYRTLLAVDDAVKTLVDALAAAGRLENTMIVFMSDNGLLWGEHRFHAGKAVPYEESIRVPFVVRYDAVIDVPRSDPSFVLNIDIAATFADVADVPAPGAEGQSFLPLLAEPSVPWREDFLVEESYKKILVYCGVRASGYLYAYYLGGEEELYDLSSDPYQMENRAGDPAMAGVVGELRSRLKALCDPTPPHLTIPADW